MRIRKITKTCFILKTNGFSIVTVLISSAILSFLGLMLVNVMKGIFDQSLRTRVISGQIALESSLLASLRSSATYQAVYLSMQQGIAPDGLNILSTEASGKLLAIEGQTIYIRLDGSPCSASEFGSANCRLSSEVDILCEKLPPDNSIRCRAAYRILGKLNNDVFVANLGVLGTQPFEDKDHYVVIPYDAYGGKQDQETSCRSDLLVAANGFFRDSGKLKCIQKPEKRCPDGTVGKSVVYDPLTNRLELNCVTASTLSCPPNFLLQSFNPSSLIMDSTPPSSGSGTCVFIGIDEVPWPAIIDGKNANPTDSGDEINGRFCPNYYRAEATCTVIATKEENKVCNECTCKCDSPPCSGTCGGETLKPTPGTCNIMVTGPYVDASIEIPDQPKCYCGPGTPSWEGKIQLQGKCVLNVPKQVQAL